MFFVFFRFFVFFVVTGGNGKHGFCGRGKHVFVIILDRGTWNAPPSVSSGRKCEMLFHQLAEIISWKWEAWNIWRSAAVWFYRDPNWGPCSNRGAARSSPTSSKLDKNIYKIVLSENILRSNGNGIWFLELTLFSTRILQLLSVMQKMSMYYVRVHVIWFINLWM